MWYCDYCKEDHPDPPKATCSVQMAAYKPLPDLSKGVKIDQDKLKWHLLPYDAISELVGVFTVGSRKYEERNWEKGMAWSRVFNSTQRHLTDWFQKRETFDPDGTGLRNIAQATWGCLVLLAWELRGAGEDDRPGETLK